MRRIRLFLGIAAAVVVLAVVAVWLLADPNRYRDVIQTQMESQLGRKVELGEMSLGLLPLRFQVEQVVIAEDPALKRTEPFIRADKVDVRVGLLSLLRGNVSVGSLELKRPSVELVRTRQGLWNFSTLGRGESGGKPFTLKRLNITDGQIGITDLQTGEPRSSYDHIDLTLLNYAPETPFTFDLKAHMQGEGSQEIQLRGEGGPVVKANPANTPFSGTLELKEVGIDGLLKFVDSKALPSARGVLSGESRIASQAGQITANGSFSLDKGQVNGVDIGYPINVDHKLGFNPADSRIAIEDATIKLDKTPVSITGTIDGARQTPTMDLRIKSGEVSIAEMARLAAAFGVAFAPGTSVTGRVITDVRAKGPVHRPELTGSVNGRDLQISGQGVPEPIHVKTVDLALTPSAIRSNEFNATSGKTTVAGQFSLFQYASDSPAIDFGLRSPGAALPEIQSIAKAYGLTSLDQLKGEGSLNFDLRAKGPLQSLDAASALKAVNGTLNLDFSPLNIAGFDMARELGKIAGLIPSGDGQKSTDILRIVGHVLVKDGIAQSDDLKAQLSIGSLVGAGTADLAADDLNLKVAAVLTKAFSDKIGGTGTGGVLNTTLRNSAGEIVVPALLTGSLKSPKFAPDFKTLAQMQKERVLPGVLDAITGPSTEEKPGGLKGIFNILRGK